MPTPVSDRRWREAQKQECDFWRRWRQLPVYKGFDLEKYWAGECRRFGLAPNFFAGLRVLDVGCGPVGLVHFLPEAAARIRLDPLLLDYNERLPLPEPQLSLAAEAERLPLAGGSVDACICFNAIDHMREPEAALAEIQRVLRPGGALLVMVHSFPAWVLPLLWADRLHPHHWTHRGASRLLASRFRLTRAVCERRHFGLPPSQMLKPSGWKYAAGQLVLSISYFTAVKVQGSTFKVQG
jgi:SAM-dependent methyltransferase